MSKVLKLRVPRTSSASRIRSPRSLHENHPLVCVHSYFQNASASPCLYAHLTGMHPLDALTSEEIRVAASVAKQAAKERGHAAQEGNYLFSDITLKVCTCSSAIRSRTVLPSFANPCDPCSHGCLCKHSDEGTAKKHIELLNHHFS